MTQSGIIVLSGLLLNHIDADASCLRRRTLPVYSCSVRYSASKAKYSTCSSAASSGSCSSTPASTPLSLGRAGSILCTATPVYAPKKYIKIIRDSISHFNAEEDNVRRKTFYPRKEQLNWLKQVESASDKVILSASRPRRPPPSDGQHCFGYCLFLPSPMPVFSCSTYGPSSVIEGISLSVIPRPRNRWRIHLGIFISSRLPRYKA